MAILIARISCKRGEIVATIFFSNNLSSILSIK